MWKALGPDFFLGTQPANFQHYNTGSERLVCNRFLAPRYCICLLKVLFSAIPTRIVSKWSTFGVHKPQTDWGAADYETAKKSGGGQSHPAGEAGWRKENVGVIALVLWTLCATRRPAAASGGGCHCQRASGAFLESNEHWHIYRSSSPYRHTTRFTLRCRVGCGTLGIPASGAKGPGLMLQ